MPPEAAIAVEHVSKHYGDLRAVAGLSFDVYSGEIFGLLGPNGSGKTTTIRMILDILKPDTGSIAVLGGPLTRAAQDRIGYLPEERGLYRNVPVLDMMIYLASLKGVPRATARRRSLEMLDRFDLADHARSKVDELSKGMQQKIQFAVTILHDPDLMIVDEPFSGLDPVNTLVIKDLLRARRDGGGAIVMSTHQMHQVEEMADRLLMIDRGEQKLYGTVAEVRERFAQHAVIVEGEGQWHALPGVTRVEPMTNGRRAALLHLAPDTTTDDLLVQIAGTDGLRIQRFEQAVPSLNDIFIEVAGGYSPNRAAPTGGGHADE